METEQLENRAKKIANYLFSVILYEKSIEKSKNIDDIVEDYYNRIDAVEDIKEFSSEELAEFKKYTKKEISNLLKEYKEIQKAYI